MKVAIIGYGNVGMAVFNALLHMPEIHELALVGRDPARIDGELTDYRDCMAIDSSLRTRISGGGYEKTAGADVIVYAVGAPVSAKDSSRLSLVSTNLAIARQVSDELNRYNRDAVLIVISNPVDVMVHGLAKYTGRPREKVIGTGTLLDSARLRRQIADVLSIPPRDVTGYVLGEHGDSSCVVWSALRILGMTPDEFLAAELGEEFPLVRERLLALNRRLGYRIFVEKGYTSCGVAAATARIVSSVIHDSREILPVSVCIENEYGLGSDVALSVPCHVGKNGASVISHMKLTDDELAALRHSADVIREAEGGLL